jgi:hypothetical protein
MKKLIFLIFALVPMLAFTQVRSTYDTWVGVNNNYGSYTGKVTDTINGVATADAVFFVEQSLTNRYTISYTISGDTLTGCSGNVTIQPQGSYDGVVYTNLGSAVTWTTTANYDANTSQNTYTESLASYTEIHTNEISTNPDTVVVPIQTKTITLPGTDYRYVKILLTGAPGARVEMDLVALKVTPIEIK